ncbi:MAG: NADH-quinone oxidoreductase subunit C [Actinomycetota bacterium]
MSDTSTDTPALPGDALREQVVAQLRDALGDALLDSLIKPGNDVWVRVRTDAWREAGLALRDIVGCHYFCFLSAIDWLPSPFGRGEDDPTQPAPERSTAIVQGYAGGETRMQVFARVTNITGQFGVTIKTDVPDDDPVVDSWIPVFAGANWHERETHEMFGISFAGHPDLRNIYLPTDFEGHPMRKDFPLLARLVKPWPGIVDVEPLPGGEEGDESGD